MNFEHSTQNTIIAALGALVFGGLLLVIGAHVEVSWISILLLNVGSFIIASVVMTLIFEFWQLRGLIKDLFRHAQVAEQLQRSQLSGFSVSFHDNVPWNDLFSESNRLNLFVAYATTWRNAHLAKLQHLVATEGAQLEVVLPDPDLPEILTELGKRFSARPDEIKSRIVDATVNI